MAFIDFLNRSFSPDLTIVCDNGELYCHRLVLSSVSTFMKMLLLSYDSCTIIVPDLRKEEFEDILAVCYGEKYETENDETMKDIFTLLSVESKKILIGNIVYDSDRIKDGRATKGMKRIRYKAEKPNRSSFHKTEESLETSADETFINISDTVLDVVQANNKSVDASETSDHAYRKYEENKRFPCDMCDKVCKRKENLTTHKKQKHGEQKLEIIVGSRVCNLCQLTFKRRDILTHMREKHPDNPLEFQCEHCDKKFKYKSKLERHSKQHHQKTERHLCPTCGFETVSEQSLRNHIYRHNTLIKCDLCEYTSQRVDYLEKHYARKHGDKEEAKFKCDICEIFLPTKDAVKKHKRRYH